MTLAPEVLLTLESLTFDNSYGRLPDAFYTRLSPTPLIDPVLVSFNDAAAALIDLDPAEAKRPELVEFANGARILPGCDPLSQVYSGHQFGHYVPRLGDGRAILLGQVLNSRGERWDLQLKGAGPTPYSRMGDGRAVLRSTIREYLVGEALTALGIPSTRALCLIGSSSRVFREQAETGAMLVRMAPSHVRFGTFEYFCYTGQGEHLRTLCDYVISHHFPEIEELPPEQRAFGLLKEVSRRTAHLAAQWQAVGFCHGVLNTDNMSILGITLDHGPFGFMDGFDAAHICNHSDHSGRYAYGRQPEVVLWNLGRLGQAMLGPVANRVAKGDDDPGALLTLEQGNGALEDYGRDFLTRYLELMTQKLGLEERLSPDSDLLSDLLELMHHAGADYTQFWRRLAGFEAGSEAAPRAEAGAELLALFSGPHEEAFRAWAERYASLLRREGQAPAARREAMNRVNPNYVLRNYMAEQAIREARQGEFGEVNTLLDLLGRPFEEQAGREAYAALPPAWACSLEVSCSS